MSSHKNSFLFIPDITGFTKFVSSTEIEHSQHIISELLEAIIDANDLDMEVSEIEGDAVLFYKHQKVPSIEDIQRQASKMFVAFHNSLARYDQYRICECGACSSATNLSLKIIAHQGQVGFTNVKNKQKPFGADLVLAHRLLKNDVPERAYLLATSSFFDNGQVSEDFIDGNSTYDTIGDVAYKYLDLSPLLKDVIIPEPPPPPKKVKKPFNIEVLIEKDMDTVFEVVSNLEYRLLWNEEVNKLEFEKERVNKIGTKHRCLFDAGMADFETITNDFGIKKKVYGERLKTIPIAREVNIYYILEEQDKTTSLRVEIHVHPLPIIGKLFIPVLKKKMMPQLKKSIDALKHVCETTTL